MGMNCIEAVKRVLLSKQGQFVSGSGPCPAGQPQERQTRWPLENPNPLHTGPSSAGRHTDELPFPNQLMVEIQSRLQSSSAKDKAGGGVALDQLLDQVVRPWVERVAGDATRSLRDNVLDVVKRYLSQKREQAVDVALLTDSWVVELVAVLQEVALLTERTLRARASTDAARLHRLMVDRVTQAIVASGAGLRGAPRWKRKTIEARVGRRVPGCPELKERLLQGGGLLRQQLLFAVAVFLPAHLAPVVSLAVPLVLTRTQSMLEQ